ncbi:hypothetical protein MHY20_05585 [Helcobacillus sp. ACRRO]|uniref:hypothetical protein n=1 Tax=Helcobacillus TaxID=1161125 RepID=UPI001EF50F50|nr:MULTISPECIES: hypothetical protein [Helcobacillus]MCG7427088.1 hypothetical protein [Helcobacillus sp. ACRRO]MDK7742967.1 hypothetical protein [Helcobacillus massiliensis]WOO93399.1 hypothetical protein R3I40_02030 [Helcobacillus massiliensis]
MTQFATPLRIDIRCSSFPSAGTRPGSPASHRRAAAPVGSRTPTRRTLLRGVGGLVAAGTIGTAAYGSFASLVPGPIVLVTWGLMAIVLVGAIIAKLKGRTGLNT